LLSGTQRVAGFLLSQLPPNGAAVTQATVTLPAQKSIIASRLNLTHEHFSRILRDIQSAGLIEVRGRQITFIDVAHLRSYPH
jgi:CRP-like cAMP-binding protein